MVIKELIKDFSPSKLKSITIYSNNTLILDGLDILKAKFNLLEILKLETLGNVVTLSSFNSNMNSVLNLGLEIKGQFQDSNISCLGDLKNLKTVKLIDYTGEFFELCDSSNSLKVIEGGNIVTLGHFDFKYKLNHNFMKLSGLNEIYVKEVSVKLLKSISLLPNVQIIQLKYFNKTTRLLGLTLEVVL